MDKRALNLGVHLSYDKQLTLSGSSSSKGNQPKWKMGVDWYKIQESSLTSMVQRRDREKQSRMLLLVY